MQNKQYLAVCLVVLIAGQSLALPQPTAEIARKYAEKPNTKKVSNSLDDVEDLSSNSIQVNMFTKGRQIQESGGNGFSWGGILGMLMQMLLGQNGAIAGPSKNEIDEGAPASPWANLLSVGLRVLTALLGGPQQPADGIDKVDNANASPMQEVLRMVLGAVLGQGRNPDQVSMIANQASEFIHIVINLLDALKTSFSHRSLHARSLGKKDTVSEAAVASISMLKGYFRSMKAFSGYGNNEEEGQKGCAERAICEASAECAADTEGTASIFCQLGSYATSYLLQKQSGVTFEALYDAGRRGRSGEDCSLHFLTCNAV